MSKSKIRKEFLVQTVRERLKAPIPSTETLGYSVMRSFAVDLLDLLDECRAYIEATLDADDETLLMSMWTGRDLVERVGNGHTK
jgi:hypothetical protein